MKDSVNQSEVNKENTTENLAESNQNLENETQEKDSLANELISNSSDIQEELKEKEIEESKKSKKKKKKKENVEEVDDSNKIFRKFKIKDIVFLAIMAACTLVTSAIMPLVKDIPVFGIIQVCLGLQFSIFPTIGMLKVRKTGSLTLMSLFCGVLLAFMNIVMFVCILVCGVLTELIVVLIFRGYKSDWASFTAGCIYFPLTLPFLYIYYNFLYTVTDDDGQAVHAFIGSNPGTAVGMSIAVICICVLGATLGLIIMREINKSSAKKAAKKAALANASNTNETIDNKSTENNGSETSTLVVENKESEQNDESSGANDNSKQSS